MFRKKHITLSLLLVMALVISLLAGCPAPEEQGEETPPPEDTAQLATLEPSDVEVRAAYDDSQIALQFRWGSTKEYAGQFHGVVQFNGTEWETAEGSVQEDRVSFMLEDPEVPVEMFEQAGCYVACHADLNEMAENTDDSRHYVLTEDEAEVGNFALDMWHWRGGRSGPMGYAEDTWVSKGVLGTEYTGRERDELGDAPTNWVRAGGDRLREGQDFDIAEWDGKMLPRFVFNPDKVKFNNYFIADANGNPITDPQQAFAMETMDNTSMLVTYQDMDFDSEDKVNAIDVEYLLFLTGEIDDPGYEGDWAGFWEEQLGVSTEEDAQAMLDEIATNMEDGVLLPSNLGFIFDSSQHDISSARDFDFQNNVWTVTLYRDLITDTVLEDDSDLSGLPDGTQYNLAFAMHDVGQGRETHHISFPYTLGDEETDSSINAAYVDDVRNVEWNNIEPHTTSVYQPGNQVSFQTLIDSETHAGAGGMANMKCQGCHTVEEVRGLLD